MKIRSCLFVLMAGLLSVNAYAAKIIDKSEFKKVEHEYVRIGSIQTSEMLAPGDAGKELIQKADEKGADVVVVTSANTNHHIHVTANIYKKK